MIGPFISRRNVILTGSAAIGATLLGSTRALSAVETPKLEKFTVVMDWLPSWKQAAFHLAKVKGWYRDEGLDVQVDDGSGSSITIAQTAAGKCDLGLASLSAMAVAYGKGSNIIAVAGIVRKNDLGMLVDRKLGITDPKQLASKGVKILFETTSFQSLFPPFFKNLGLDISQLSLVPMSAASAIGAYLSGQGGALITTVPYVAPLVQRKRPSSEIMFADHGLPFPAHGLVASHDSIKSRPAAIRKFLAASAKGWNQVWHGDAKEAIQALIDQRPLAKINAQLALERVMAYRPFAATKAAEGHGVFWMPPTDWEAAINVMRATGLVPPGSKPTDFYTNEFVPVK